MLIESSSCSDAVVTPDATGAGLATPRISLGLANDGGPDAAAAAATACVAAFLPAEFASAARGFAAAEGTTLGDLALAAFEIVLSRYSGEERFAIGYGADGAAVRIVRAELGGDPTFADVVRRVGVASAGDDAAGHASFAFAVDCDPRPFCADGYEVVFSLAQIGDGCTCEIAYRSDLYEPAAMQRLLGHVRTILESGIAGVGPVARLPMLDDAELAAFRADATGSARRIEPSDFVHRAFAAAAAHHAGRIAVSIGSEHVTYEELNRRADDFAGYLRARGAGRNRIVGVMLERSIETIVALLATLKAGAAYLPLDPATPGDRLRYMSESARPALLITSSRFRERADFATCPVVEIDGDADAIAQTERILFRDDVRADDLAYVMFTSGSTGRPKGVMISHEALANETVWTRDVDRVTADDCVLQQAPVTFDLSVWEIFTTLASGARLVLVRPEHQYDIVYVLRLLRDERVTITAFVPSVLAVISRLEPFASCARNVRQIVCVGEALPVEVATRVAAVLPDTTILNYYGPTEATVYVTRGRFEDSGGREPYVSIGYPAYNTQIYVLDRNLQPLPVGVAGELCIGGTQVARGYVDQPVLTAERFVVDPFVPEGEARIYRTGDVARRLSDGSFAYVGRNDDLVKIRGVRIELGEIEATVRQHAGIADCAVVVRGVGEHASIAAYCVVTPDVGDLTADLRAMLAERLPEYMLPSSIVLIDELPRSHNGKLDRRSLPDPIAASSAAYAEPQSPLESRIAEMFATVLDLARVGRDDDFFRLGGTSLGGMQIVARLAAEISVELPFHVLFESPTVAQLAVRCSSAPAIVRERRDASAQRGEAPLSFAQEILWLAQRTSPLDTAYNETVAYRCRGALDTSALERALADVAHRQPALRSAFVEIGANVIVRTADDVTIALDVRELRDRADPLAAARTLAREIAYRPFDLRVAPLVRAFAFRIGDDEWFVGFTFHHIIVDQWSLRLFARELSERYAARRLASESDLALPAPLVPTFADFAAAERSALRGAELERLVTHWRSVLAGTTSRLELPDLPTNASAIPEADVRSQRWAGDLLTRVREVSRSAGTTMFVTLLAGFHAVLSRYTGATSLAIGVPHAARRTVADADVIGYYTKILPIRADVDPNATFDELVRDVRAASVAAAEHAAIPFEHIADMLGAPATPERSPFAATFNFDPLVPSALSLPDIDLAVEPVRGRHAKFDISLNVAETAHGFDATVEYRRDRYAPETIDRLLESVRTFLEGATVDLQQPVGRVAIVPADERRRLLARTDESGTGRKTHAHVREAIAARAAAAPDAIALACDGATLSYGELDARATGLAAALRARAVAPGSFVGIFLERSIDAIVAMVAVLEAGCAYVPVDPTAPAARIETLLSDAKPAAVITSASYRPALATYERHGLVVDVADANDAAGAEVEPTVRDEDAAYVIYTSGSTGQPKGVIVPHRGLTNMVAAMQTAYPLARTDAVLQWASLGFDASVFEIFATLCAGARLVIVKPDGTLDATYLTELVPRERVTVVLAIPSIVRVMLETGVARAWTTVERLFFGAEAVTPELVASVRAALPNARLANLYGPTETSVIATTWAISPAATDRVPIGRPLANVRTYVLSPDLQLQPIGVPGELFVGGACVANGYLDRETLTAERFVANPFRAGDLLYRTGDRVALRADGALDFFGRLDSQIKLHGIRIELGEIEAALRALEDIRDAVCALRDAGAANARIVAYVVLEPGIELDAARLRDALARVLPTSTLPAAFVAIERVPLMASGKTDRAALPELDGEVPVTVTYAAPRTVSEIVVGEIWAEVLGRSSVSRDDEFFAVGGDSLSAMRVAVRIEHACAVVCPVRVIFEQRTVAAIAAYVDRNASPVARDDDEIERLLSEVDALSDEQIASLTASPTGERP